MCRRATVFRLDRTGSAADGAGRAMGGAGRGDATSATCFRKRSSSGLVLEKAACACVMKFVMKFIKKRVRNQSFCYISIFYLSAFAFVCREPETAHENASGHGCQDERYGR